MRESTTTRCYRGYPWLKKRPRGAPRGSSPHHYCLPLPHHYVVLWDLLCLCTLRSRQLKVKIKMLNIGVFSTGQFFDLYEKLLTSSNYVTRRQSFKGQECKIPFKTLPNHVSANGEQMAITPSMICSHSVSGDLHGVQHDRIAVDILRKEPEHENFTRLTITPLEALSPDEVEAYVVLQECLEMRKRYIFREVVAPWDKEVISDPNTPQPNPDPFLYIPEVKSDVRFFLPPLKTWISLCYMLRLN